MISCLWVFNNIGWYYYRQLKDDKVNLQKRSFEKFVEQKELVIREPKTYTGSTWSWNNKNLTLTLRERYLANYKQCYLLKSLSVFWHDSYWVVWAQKKREKWLSSPVPLSFSFLSLFLSSAFHFEPLPTNWTPGKLATIITGLNLTATTFSKDLAPF